jgi:hypothetical protein
MATTGFDVTLRRPLADGRAFGSVGPYEELKGRLRLAIDPRHEANARITDVELAPRNAAGLVEFSADLSLLAPLDRARANGRALIDVVNRGNTVALPNFNRATRPVFKPGADPHPAIDVGDGFLMRHGFAVASCGWQGDVPLLPGLFRLHGPDAQDAAGRPLRGRVLVELQPWADVPHLLLADRGHLPYPAADLDEEDACLTVRGLADAEPEIIPRARWRFARTDDGAPQRNATHVWLEGGFAKGLRYQLTYTAVGAPVRGLGLAVLRDCAAWLKHGSQAAGNPMAGSLHHVYAYGRSQTGRLLRTLLYLDLNLDEGGREAFDGVIANVAGGLRGEFNQRFGQNSKDRPHAMAHLFPFTDMPQSDPVSGATGAVHARLEARKSPVKVFYTNSSAEYHRGDASLIHIDVDGKRDVTHGPSVRIYHFAGTEHALGVWPPTDRQLAAADPTGGVEHSQNLRNVINYGPLLRAALLNLDRWVVEGIEPPPSRHPRLDDGTAVAPDELRPCFDRIPGTHYPRRHALPRRLDFSVLPPRLGPALGSRVSAVDADGNEVAGLRLPEVAVPVATFTGWTLRHPDIGGEDQLLIFAGATLPFARTRREREARGDPRPAIEERYASREDYLAQIRQTALALVVQRYLLEEDVDVSVAAAARLWDHFTAGREA